MDVETNICAYCRERRGHTKDHLIPRAVARRNPAAAQKRQSGRYIVRCCLTCNHRKGARLRVPTSLAHLIPELSDLTKRPYAVWDGTPEGLREVVK